MENKVFEQWLQELRNQLAILDGEPIIPLERLKHTLPLINSILHDVKKCVLADGFATPEQEIQFFKVIKPQFYALELFELLTYHIEVNTPGKTKEMVHAFLEDELNQVLRYFKVNAFHYQYYKCRSTELDHVYFLRNGKPSDIPIIELIDPSPGFSSTMDYSFAKFMAYERLQEYLLEELTMLYGEEINKPTGPKNWPSLRWTGETINLAELGYGIWLTGQVNNGNATITEILEGLEIIFQVKIGLAFRRWASISKRKKISPTKYIGQMKAAILKRLDDENGLK